MRLFAGRIARNHQRRPAIAFYNARGHNADYAAVPALAVEREAQRRECSWRLVEVIANLLEDARLFLLPLGIQAVEFQSKLHRMLRVFRAEHFDDVAGHVHAARRVNARTHAKSQITGAQPALAWWIQACCFKQRLEPRISWLTQSSKPQVNEDSVLAYQRDRIGDSCNRDQFQKRRHEINSARRLKRSEEHMC